MNFKIIAIKNAGEFEKERLVLRAREDGNAGDNIVLCAREYQGRPLAGPPRHAYWVPDADIKKGDFLILYTKSGLNRKRENASGTNSHFHYWKLEASIWESEAIAVVIETSAYEYLVVDANLIGADIEPGGEA